MSRAGQPALPDDLSAPPAPTLAQALRFWLRLGCISFGGPAGQISLMHTELVERRRWISEGRYLHALNYCMLLPGPEAQQLATYLGWLLHGTRGGIAAGALFVLPSLLLLIALSWIYMALGQTPAVAGVLWGIKPAVTAIVVAAAWRIGKRSLKNAILWAIAFSAFVAIYFLNAPFPTIIIASAVIGWIGSKVSPASFRSGGGHASASSLRARAVVDDDTPTPAHARFSRSRLLGQLAVGLGLWAAVMVLLALSGGLEGTLAQMGWFFTKAALLTFGGAYAVLPYVAQAAVTQHAWLSAPQMIDGLALGETTPGPLIMVVAFVAFVGGWTHPMFGTDAIVLAALVSACVATFFTFLPSFVFILAGGPLVEATHGQLGFTAPLVAVTAAVVGVIVNLSVFFAQHVLWPDGFGGAFAWASSLIGLASGVALMRFRVSVTRVIGACALIGLARALMG